MRTSVTRILRSGWESDLERFGVGRRVAAIVFVAPVVGVVLLVLLRIMAYDAFRLLVREDSIFEWLTVAAFLITAVAAGLTAPRLWRTGLRWQAVLWAGFAGACIFAAGEEISWGERVLPFDGAAGLQVRNLQEETTIHNLEGVYSTYLLALFLIGVYGSVVTWVLRTWTSARQNPNLDLFFPPLFLTAPFALMASYRVVRLVVDVVGTGEWIELCVAVALAIFAVLTCRRLSTHRLGRNGSPARPAPDHRRSAAVL